MINPLENYNVLGFLDLVLVMRWNLAFGIPDSMFMIGDEIFSQLMLRLNTMPLFVLAASKLALGFCLALPN